MLLTSLLFPTLALATGTGLFARQQGGGACTSDDSCKTPCSTPAIRAEGVNVTPSEQVQAEARRRFGDAHCVESKCSCAITSDDQAQDFCQYWIENAKEEFNGARYVNGGVDADKGTIYCVYATPA